MPIELIKIIKEGTKAVPAVKYGLGIAALAALVAIIASSNIDLRITLWGTIILLGLMVLLVVFAKLSKSSNDDFKGPANFLMWSMAFLFVIVSFLLATSVFFKVPVDLQYVLLKDESSTRTTKENNHSNNRTSDSNTVNVKVSDTTTTQVNQGFHGSQENNKSDISVKLEDMKQTAPITGNPPNYNGVRVYCEQMNLQLLISHNQLGNTIIRLRSVQIEYESIKTEVNNIIYNLDADKIAGYGIINVDEYIFSIKNEREIFGKYIVNKDKSIPVSKDNLLRVGSKSAAYDLNTIDAYCQKSVNIELTNRGFYRVRFRVNYTILGKSLIKYSSWVYLLKI